MKSEDYSLKNVFKNHNILKFYTVKLNFAGGRDMLKDWIFHTLQKFPTRSFAINRSQSQTKKSPNQSQMHDTMNEGNIITIETKAENSFLNAPKLAIRNKRKQKGGNGLMMIAILHLLLACGLIDLGMFLSIRFNHYGDIWPDSYVKLTVSEFRLYRNQMLSIRLLYSPVTIAIGLMIFFPKSIYLLIIFFSKVSFCRTMIVDGIISFVTLIYACITGVHAYIILHNISRINIGDRSDILCYAIRGPREKASQALRDHCLLVAYKMFGNHLSLQSIIAIFVIIVCIVNFIYLFYETDRNVKRRRKVDFHQNLMENSTQCLT